MGSEGGLPIGIADDIVALLKYVFANIFILNLCLAFLNRQGFIRTIKNKLHPSEDT